MKSFDINSFALNLAKLRKAEDMTQSELADKLNVLGDVNFEYILDKNGTYHFVECNPRFSAGCGG